MPDFHDYALFGLRDLAAVIEDCSTMSVGGTHLAMVVMDYRTADGGSRFMPLVGALGRAQMEAMS